MRTTTLTLFAIACAAAMATTAAAQDQSTATWRGQDNEFGSIRAPYTVDMSGGERAPVEAQVVLRDLYTEKDGRFYMFQLNTRGTPLDAQLNQIVRTDTGQELPCYQIEEDAEGIKCTVDLRQMPPENTEIKIYGTVGSSRTGTYTVGALVLPFTATWTKIQMDNGLDAELYAGTQVNVLQATSGTNTIGGIGNKIPTPGTLAVVGAVGTAALLAAVLRGRKTQ